MKFKNIRLYIPVIAFLFSSFTAVLVAKDKDSKKEKNNPGMKLVVEMLSHFNKVDANRQKYIDGKQSYDQYMKEDKKLSDIISGYIDFYDVCEKSLKYDYDPKKKIFKKDHWFKRSFSDKNNFTAVFRQLIETIVYPIAGDYFKDLEMRHKVLSSKKNDIHLKTFIKNKKRKKRRDQEYIMEWFLHPKKDGPGWIIYDISIEDERWVPGFRSQFNDVISKKNYDELVKMMKDKLKEVLDDRKTKDQKERKEAGEKKAEAKNAETKK